MLDVRYHILYLCAVFLMLGFGILIGESLFGQEQVHRQILRQAKDLAALRDQVNKAVQDGRAAQDELAKTEEAIDALRPGLVQGKLSGKHVVLIQTGDYADATQAASSALADAGASVSATVVLTGQWGILSPKARKTILEELNLSPNPGPASGRGSGSTDEPTQGNLPLLNALASTLISGESSDPRHAQARQALENRGLIVVTGDLSLPCTEFVFIGGGTDATDPGSNTVDNLDMPLLEQLRIASGGNAAIVGCEPLNAAVSYMADYQKENIATVDCIDRPLGQLALPFALRGGGDKDDYGLKSTASRHVPPSLEGAVSS